jgi:hypothetical protein
MPRSKADIEATIETIHQELIGRIEALLPGSSIGTLTNVLRVIERFEPEEGRGPLHYRTRDIDRRREEAP